MPQNEQQPYLDAKMRRLEQVSSSSTTRLIDCILDRNDYIQYLEQECYYLKEETFNEMRAMQSYYEGQIHDLTRGY
jgi:hypothetical protein